MRADRLLNVAKALRESKNPAKFTMKRFGWECGTPACALGHYAARTDLQDAYLIDGNGVFSLRTGPDRYGELLLQEHFDLSEIEVYELFGSDGCAKAKTPIEAAEYIERFVVEHS